MDKGERTVDSGYELYALKLDKHIQTKGKLRQTLANLGNLKYNYNLGYFSLWWGRMESEGKKDAEASKMKTG